MYRNLEAERRAAQIDSAITWAINQSTATLIQRIEYYDELERGGRYDFTDDPNWMLCKERLQERAKHLDDSEALAFCRRKGWRV